MTKKELRTFVARKTGIKKKDVEKVLDCFYETVGDELAAGRYVQITGFGSFEARKRIARTAINPQTGEEVAVPETVAPTFRAGKTLKEKVRRV